MRTEASSFQQLALALTRISVFPETSATIGLLRRLVTRVLRTTYTSTIRAITTSSRITTTVIECVPSVLFEDWSNSDESSAQEKAYERITSGGG